MIHRCSIPLAHKHGSRTRSPHGQEIPPMDKIPHPFPMDKIPHPFPMDKIPPNKIPPDKIPPDEIPLWTRSTFWKDPHGYDNCTPDNCSLNKMRISYSCQPLKAIHHGTNFPELYHKSLSYIRLSHTKLDLYTPNTDNR